MKRKTPNIHAQIAAIRRTPFNVLRSYEKRGKLTQLVLEVLNRDGSFFQTPQGGFYFQSKPKPQLLPLRRDSLALSAFIDEKFGLNAAERREFEHLVCGLENEAFLRGEHVQVHRLSHYEVSNGNLYVSRFDGWMYKLDGNRIRKVRNGTDGIFFWDDPSWQPYELVPTGTKLFERMILSSANFTSHNGLSPEDQQWICGTWLLSQFFGSLHPTKPLLLICGEKGSGKTSLFKMWMKLIFGERAQVSGLERGKADGFIATVSTQPIAIFDNVDEHVSWLPDHLAQLATGIAFRRRKYYTTNEETEYQPKCFVGLTSRTPKFANGRDDVLDRTLVLQTARRTGFTAEQTLSNEIRTYRNGLYSELLRELNQIVAFLRKHGHAVGTVNFRMADFATFAIILGRLRGEEAKVQRILRSMEHQQTEMLLQGEPVRLCLAEWLKVDANVGRRVTSSDLHRELGEAARTLGLGWPYASAHSLGQKLTHITTNLQVYFDLEVGTNSSNQKHYRFWPLQDSEPQNRSESRTAEVQAA